MKYLLVTNKVELEVEMPQVFIKTTVSVKFIIPVGLSVCPISWLCWDQLRGLEEHPLYILTEWSGSIL